jgi:long-chain fatty acid transport protein
MNIRTLSISIALTATMATTMNAHATNGYFRLGYGANSIAMGGTGTALAQDGLAGAVNPATIFSIDQTYTLALSAFNPQRGFDVTGAGPADATSANDFPLTKGKVESDSEYFLIPSLGYKRTLNKEWAMSVSLYGNGGMNTDYSESVFYAGKTGVDLTQMFINTAFAFKASDTTQLGFSPIIAVQTFEAKGIGSFAQNSKDADKLSNEGRDTVFGYGARIGIAHQINANVHLGASYQTRIDFERFKKYQGLFAENGDMDIPSTYNLGIAFDNSNFTLALDYQVINYSEVAAVANPLMPNLMSTKLGDNKGAGFGWNDMDVIKLGGALKRQNGDVIRAGISYGEQPIDSSEVLFNILAPGVQEWHYTAGYEFGEIESRYSIALSYSPLKSVKGKNPLYGSKEQFIEIEMEQYELTFSAAF